MSRDVYHGDMFTGPIHGIVGGRGNINTINMDARSVFEMLERYTAFSAVHNSRERESEHASVCLEQTRVTAIDTISTWGSRNYKFPICWLHGPAGSGKSTIAHTMADKFSRGRKLAFSFFFSRGKADRGDTTKFVTTFAYQLASSVPAVQTAMQRALLDEPSIPTQSLHDQLKKLIIDPLLSVEGPIALMTVVVDGLDECSDKGGLRDLIQLLVGATGQFPFQFLFASRAETHIQQTFESPEIKNQTYFLSLRDFDVDDDIRIYLRSHLSKIRDKEDRIMQYVPRPWPLEGDVDLIVRQSEGLFIYVSTLVKFVGDGTGLPQQRLQDAMKVHVGLDPLYHQVLSEARKFQWFERVLGAVVLLRQEFTLPQLDRFLDLPSGASRVALRGGKSILCVPDVDQGFVRPYHASLKDFLTDKDRAEDHLLDTIKHRAMILVDCLGIIKMEIENDEAGSTHLEYACQNWCHHLCMVLEHGGSIGDVEALLGGKLVTFMTMLEKQWLKLWICKLGSLRKVRSVLNGYDSAMTMMNGSAQCDDLGWSMSQTKQVVNKLHNSYRVYQPYVYQPYPEPAFPFQPVYAQQAPLYLPVIYHSNVVTNLKELLCIEDWTALVNHFFENYM